jgi:hypothetical protein
MKKQKRPVSPNGKAGHSPARHRSGARFARWKRCLSIVTQTNLKREN